MSSSGPYRSRLFGFVSRQSTQLIEKYSRGLRHLKIAASWGAQILLYPAYVLFQSTRLVGRQFQQTVRQGLPQLEAVRAIARVFNDVPPAVTADAAVDIFDRVLQTVQSFSLPINLAEVAPEVQPPSKRVPLVISPWLEGSKESLACSLTTTGEAKPLYQESAQTLPQTSTLQSTKIQGVATLLETKTLVLVTTQNLILDVLTSEQQQKLSQRILWEVAGYWRQRRTIEATRSQANLPIQPPSERAKALLPVRIFRRLMAWVQTGPVAIATNLFQESQLSLPSPQNSLGKLFLPSVTPQAVKPESLEGLPNPLLLLDRTIADLEAGDLSSVTALGATVKHRTSGLVHTLWSRLASRSSPTAEVLSDNAIPQNLTSTESRSFEIAALLRAAIDYFFGDRHEFFGNHQQSLRSATPEAFLLDGAVIPELAVPKLGSKVKLPANLTKFSEIETSAPVKEVTKSLGLRETGLWLTLRDLFGETTTLTRDSSSQDWSTGPEAIALLQTTFPSLNRSSDRSSRIADLENAAIAPSLVPDDSPDLAVANSLEARHPDPTSSWIEIEATSLGYVKHPLEQLLAWLDYAMLWLEETTIRFWQWAHHR